MEKIIEISHLKKYFKDVKAVDDISFSVEQGQLFSFLGLNGAGKSTTINILVGILEKDSGDVVINGKDPKNFGALSQIGIVFQNSVLDKKLSAYDNIKFRADLYNLSADDFKKNLDFLSEKLDLRDILRKPLEKLSGGQKRKVDIARALIHDPNILILDEPTTGLDPKTRALVWSLVTYLRREKKLTVLLTTHYMEEAVDSDYVVIMDSGKIVARGTPNYLKNKYASEYVRLYSYSSDLLKILDNSDLSYTKTHENLVVRFDSTKLALNFLTENADKIDDFEVLKGSMDDVFLTVTGKQLKENV